jgi:hypothetical protein
MPQTLMCAKSSGLSDLIFSWNPPTSQRNEIIGYRVDVKRLAHREGTREVVQSDVVTFTTPKTKANITEGLGTSSDTLRLLIVYISIPLIAAEIPYNITVKAVNLAGCGRELQVYCFSREGQGMSCTAMVC